jgi:hypothetical protein
MYAVPAVPTSAQMMAGWGLAFPHATERARHEPDVLQTEKRADPAPCRQQHGAVRQKEGRLGLAYQMRCKLHDACTFQALFVSVLVVVAYLG